MRHLSSRRRAVAAVAVAGLGALLWTGCIDQSQDSILGPDPGLEGLQVSPDIEGAITAQQRHTPALLGMSGVVGTAVARSPDGEPRVLLYLESPNATAVYPSRVDGIPVEVVVSGRLMAIADRTAKERPAPIGFSVGHPSITAGTFGTRVKNAAGDVFILSNNHVLAASNDAQIGDPTLQPGAFDGGGPGDEIGTLAAFQPIDFSTNGFNVMDAAITATTVAQAGNATPPDEGYGTPNSAIFGDGNGDGVFDNEGDLLGL
ncbi:MAG TPA: hypothetical protein VLL48_14485, partial [Longimicrobiales bacterium]|nr:hypothetical protein [Longimicrobiales bacterium]